MKTIDTSKLWHVHAETEKAFPEIVGPGGITMDLYDATTEQAQEIADILNGATVQPLYSVRSRAGDVEVTYSAPAADEVMWMVRQDEERVEGVEDGPKIDLSFLPGMIPSDESRTLLMGGGRQSGKTTAMLTDAANRIQNLTRQLEAKEEANHGLERRAQILIGELGHYKALAEERQQGMERLTYERQAWEDTAASYSRSIEWYCEQLDRCGVALGNEAYVSDDGSVQDKPLRAKVAEMVEKLISERNKLATERFQAQCDLDNVREQADEMANAVARYLHIDIGEHSTTNNPWERATNSLRSGADAHIAKRGPCAKQRVRATIIATDGRRFVGENDCLNPQAACPRDAAGFKTGEGYHMCRQACLQTGHAEINAIRAAGPAAKGAFMYIEGHTYACEPCRKAMVDAGIRGYTTGTPPEESTQEGPSLPDDHPAALRQLANWWKHKYGPPVLRALNSAADELQRLREQSQSTLGVGDGSGNLFVHGSYDAIKIVQSLILQPIIPDVPTMRDAFITYESGEAGYRMAFKFPTIDQLHQAGREWNGLDRALKERAK